ncbi:MAG: oxygenase MpaB family protein [Marmoricola sp.]
MTTTTDPRAAEGAVATVPERYRSDPAWSERFAAPLLLLAGPGARMRGAELERLRDGLLRRDEVATALVRAVREEHVVTMPQFRTALADGIDAVPEAPEPLRRFFEHVEARPDWVDDELLERGARVTRRIGPDGFDVLAYGSLLGGYRTGGPLQPLVREGRLTGTETLRRVGETGQWWLGVTSRGGMHRYGEGWRLSVHVRMMHAFLNYQLERDPDWDWSFRGVPINAYDQAATLGTFSTSYLLQARALGVRISARDSAAIMHLWSYVGWLMGVEDELLPRTERVGRRVLGNIVATLSPPEATSRMLGEALVRMHDQAPGIRPWRRVYERERALSVATYLNLGLGMRDVGQPARPPWYPALRVPVNLFWSHLVGRLPGGRRLLDRRAERGLARLDAFQYAGRRPPTAEIRVPE